MLTTTFIILRNKLNKEVNQCELHFGSFPLFSDTWKKLLVYRMRDPFMKVKISVKIECFS